MQFVEKEWQVETQGQIYEADFDELKRWIAEGAILPLDRVKRRNLRWLSADKVPELCPFFDADELNPVGANEPVEDVSVFDEQYVENQGAGGGMPDNQTARTGLKEQPLEPDALPEDKEWEARMEKNCSRHENSEAVFACGICKKAFCKICPKTYGASVNLCPCCGALCVSTEEMFDIHKTIGAVNKPYSKKELEELEKHSQSNLRTSKFAGNSARSRLTKLIFAAMIFLILSAAISGFFFSGKH